MEYVFILYIITGLCIMWEDRDRKPLRKLYRLKKRIDKPECFRCNEKVQKSNIIYFDFFGKKKII